MARLYIIIVLIVLAFTIYAFVDCLVTSNSRIRTLPKAVWAIVVLIVAPIGGILWFALGKERLAGAGSRPGRVVTAPDDDPAFLRRLAEEKEREERIKQLEQQLADLDDDHSDPTD